MDKNKFYNEAKKVAKDNKCNVVIVNEDGDFFTNMNRAMLSVKQDKNKLAEFDFTEEFGKEAAKKAGESNDAKAAKAKEAVLGKITKAKTAEAAQALLAGFEDDADVKAAVEAKLEELNKKYVLTAEDIEKIPELAKANLKAGDEISFNPSEVSKKQLTQLLGQ